MLNDVQTHSDFYTYTTTLVDTLDHVDLDRISWHFSKSVKSVTFSAQIENTPV